jgi:myo-inositol 2-dehydrogenase / D-chiro-inositol 1-dehydrogenase
MATFRLGVIGCGGMARAHLRNARHTAGLQLYGYADVNVEAAQRCLHEFGGAYATDDPQRLLRDDAVDAVLIATHHDSHAGLAIGAATAGKHVLVEKPLAMTVAECQRVAEAVERTGARLMVGFKLRYAPLVQEARRYVPQPRLLVGQMMDNRWADQHWAQDPVTGGGNVLSQGCHTFDLLAYLAQSEPVQVYAAGGTFTHDPAATDVIDNLAGTITFASGAAASVIQGDAGAPDYVSKFFFELFDGQQAVQLYDRLHRMTLSGPAHRPAREVRAEDVAPGQDPEGLAQELEEFVRYATTGTPPAIGATVRDGTRATAIALALFESVRTGQPQPV